jgi:peptidoglycan/LPS O-acetylase OafA/YrhL
VLLFFIHTSFVLMMSLERLHQESDAVTWQFYIRRFFRIYPLSTFAILMVVAFNMPVGIPLSGWGNLWENILLVQNIRLHPRVVLGPLWSLPYEVQMYVVFPLLYAVVMRARNYLQIAMVFAIGMMSQQMLAVLLERAAGLGHLLMVAPWFLLGVCAYGIWRWRRFTIPSGLYLPILVVFCAVLTVLKYPWVLGGAFAFLLPHFEETGSVFLRRPAHYVAKYSYGIYLSHVPVLWLAFDKLHTYPIALRMGVCLVLLTAVPVALYHLLEEPMIKVGAKLASARRHRQISVASPVTL